jgi:hypothetical protein
MLASLMPTKLTGLGNSHWAMVIVIEDSSKMACFMGKEFSIRGMSTGYMDLFMRAGREAW